MFTVLRSSILFCLSVGLLAVAHASEHGDNVSTIDINFAQTYALIACPSSAPVGYGCLNVTGLSDHREAGHAEFQRVVLFNGGQFDFAHPTCIDGETSGTLMLPKGTLSFHAPGKICFTEGIASYDLIIIGGTGAYAGALGGGKVIVPPPQSNSTGRELWHIELFKSGAQ
jgi:hypothetical protein